jgi:transglutaminase-like putative cysteine protease
VTRRGWAVVILAAWAASLGWLVRRTYFQSTGQRLAEAALAVPPGAVFYRITVGAQQIGFASTTIDTLKDTIRVEDALVVDVPALGHVHRTTARSEATLDRALRLRQVAAYVDGDDGRFTAHGEMVGDSSLRLILTTGEDSQLTWARFERPPALPSLLPLRLAFGGELKIGRTYGLRVFDPALLLERDVAVRVAVESTLVVPDSADYDSTAMAWVPVHFDTVRAFRLDQRSQGLTSSSWVDAQGRLVRVTSGTGVTVERAPFEVAYENFRRRDTTRLARASANPGIGELVPTTAIAAGVRLAPDSTTVFRVRLVGPLEGVDLASERQQMAGDTLTVRREPAAALTAQRGPIADTALRAYLRPEPLLQSGNPRIQAQARLVAGRERDAAKVAAALAQWVADNVRNEVGTTAPSALAAFERRRGDCSEHAALFVALARASGIPARPVSGLLYRNRRFYYHAWAEVYLRGWVAVDPELGELPADATHLRFVVGGLAQQMGLTRLLAKLRLEAL